MIPHEIKADYSTNYVLKCLLNPEHVMYGDPNYDNAHSQAEVARIVESFGYPRRFAYSQLATLYRLFELDGWPQNVNTSINIIYDDFALTEFINQTLKEPITVNVITTKLILEVLAADEIYRGKNGVGVGWPLVTKEGISKLVAKYSNAIYDSDIPIMKFTRTGDHLFPKEREVVDASNHNNDFDLVKYHNKRVNQILKFGRGHLVAAGSYALNRFRGSYSQARNDVDFFIIGFRIDQQNEANALIQEVIDAMRIWVMTEDYYITGDYAETLESLPKESNIFRSTRSQNVVNMLLVNPDGLLLHEAYSLDAMPLNCYDAFQIILRLYPTTGDLMTDISLPLGGFDLYSCAIAYYLHPGAAEGSIYATPAGAFAIATGLNFVNSGRVSTSMNHRLMKYAKREFMIACPGVRIEEFTELPHHEKNFGVFFRTPNIGWNVSSIVDVSDYQAKEQSDDRSANFEALLTNKLEQYVVPNSHAWYDSENYFKDRFKINIDKFLRAAKHCHPDCVRDLPFINRLKVYKFFIPHFQELNPVTPNLDGVNDRDKELKIIEAKQECLKNAINEAKKFVHVRFRLFEKMKPQMLKEFEELTAEFMRIMVHRQHQAIDGLQEIKINIKNPLRQHTASNNPIVVNPEKWWGQNYVRTRIGLPDEIYFIMKMLFINHAPGIFKQVLLPYIAKAYADGVVESLLSNYDDQERSNYIFTMARTQMFRAKEQLPSTDNVLQMEYNKELITIFDRINEMFPRNYGRMRQFKRKHK